MKNQHRTHISERTALEQQLRDESAHARRKSRDVKSEYLIGHYQGLACAYKYSSILVRDQQILRGLEALAKSN